MKTSHIEILLADSYTQMPEASGAIVWLRRFYVGLVNVEIIW